MPVTLSGGDVIGGHTADDIRRGGGRVGPPIVENWNPIGDIPETPPPVAIYGSSTSTAIRQVEPGTSVTDTIIPCVFGPTRVEGRAMYVSAPSVAAVGFARIAYLLCWGEQDSVTDIKVGGQPIANVPWIENYYIRYGTGAQTKPTQMDRVDTAYPGICYVLIEIPRSTDEQIPTQISLSAVCGGQKIVDFRTGGAAAVNTNPACIAYHMLTDSEQWIGLDSARISTASWEVVADWCDEVVDGAARWAWSGRLDYRDMRAALTEVLGSCFAALYLDAEKKIRLWAEMPPPAIAGLWTSAGSTTITGVGGDALTALAGITYAFFGTTLAAVLSVGGDNSVTVDRAVTCADALIRPITTVRLTRSDMVSDPEEAEAASNRIPDVVVVKYTDGETFGTLTQHCEDPAGYVAASVRRTETTVRGCRSAAQAERYGQQLRLQQKLQRYSWDLHVGSTAAALEPGDVFLLDDAPLSEQPARVLPPITSMLSGTFRFTAREFDIASYSDATAAEDTPISTTGEDPWLDTPPDEPTSVTRVLGFGGPWASKNLLPDEGDLTVSQGWSWAYGTPTYDGVNVTTSPFSSAQIEASHTFTPPASGRIMLLVHLDIDGDDGVGTLSYFTNLGTEASTPIGLSAARGYSRAWITVDVNTSPSVTYHAVRISVTSASGTSVVFRDIYVIAMVTRPQLSLYERWEWVEDASSGDTVARYEMIRAPTWSATISPEWPIFATLTEGVTELEFQRYGTGVASGGTGEYGYYLMRAVGFGKVRVYFPAESTTFETRALSLPTSDIENIDETGIGEGKVMTADAAGTGYVLRQLGAPAAGFDQDYSSSVAITFTDGTRTFQIAPTGSDFRFFVSGIEYTKSSAETVVITDTQGLWFIYYNSSGVLTASQTEWDLTQSDFAPVAVLYWDATNNTAIRIEYNLHSWEIDRASLAYLHDVLKTRWVSGLAVSTPDDAVLDITGGVLRNDDIVISVTDDAGSGTWDQSLTPASLPILYRTGASGLWEKLSASTVPCHLISNVPQINLYSGGSWILQDVGTARFFAYWVVASGGLLAPVFLVPGQVDDGTEADAKTNNTLASMDFAGLPDTEHKAIARIIMQRSASSPYYTISSIDDYREIFG